MTTLLYDDTTTCKHGHPDARTVRKSRPTDLGGRPFGGRGVWIATPPRGGQLRR